jgi:hypothetical protein
MWVTLKPNAQARAISMSGVIHRPFERFER